MITLKTLPQATAQEVFDHVATHLLTQYQQSVDPVSSVCQYRIVQPTGRILSCAAGCLMADDEYDPSFEGAKWDVLNLSGHVPSEHINLIIELQSIHDVSAPDVWREDLSYLAYNMELDPSVLDNFA